MSLGPLNVVKQSNLTSSAAVIFLHGSGDTGKGFLDWIRFLVGDITSPYTKYYFPTAPLRPYTPLKGERSHVWFDRYNITPDAPEHEETLNAIGAEINNLITRIINSGVPRNRIIVGGFSMGGCLALHTGFRYSTGLAGVFTLSSFLSNTSAIYNDIVSVDTPLYMCHGDKDTMVPSSWGKNTFNELTKLGVKGQFITIHNAMHEIKKQEIIDLMRWIQEILPPQPNKL